MLCKYESGVTYLEYKKFNSGLAPVDDFIKKGNYKDHKKKNYNQTYFFLDPNNRIIGYYTLQAFSLTREFMSDLIPTSLPTKIPVFRISLLGVDLSQQRKGIGTALIGDAAKRTTELQQSLGTIGLYLDAEYSAIPLYQKCGFKNITPINNNGETPMFLNI